MLTGIKPGSRLRSPVCDVEVIVIKSPGSDLDLRCGGKPMIQMDEERSTGVRQDVAPQHPPSRAAVCVRGLDVHLVGH